MPNTFSTRPWKHDLKVAAVLGLASALATAALMPYLMQLMPEKFARIPVPMPVLVGAQIAQALVLMFLLSLLGLRMGHRTALGAPMLQHWLNRAPMPTVSLRPWHSALLGVLAALAVILASKLIDPMLPAMRNPPAELDSARSALNGFLASFYGGIVEEIQLRLFLATFLVWVIARVKRTQPRAHVYWLAIVAAALLFGVGHLPAAAQVWGLDAIVITRTVLLNAIAGVVFGWLYWKRGLEMAIVGHFSADIVLHVLPAVLPLGATP